MTETNDAPIIPPEKRERLILLIHPKRASFLFNYVLGVFLFAIGLIFFVASAAQVVVYSELSYWIGITALIIAVFLVGSSETKRRYTVYILTTWNIRVKSGYTHRTTERVFYDDIIRVETVSDRYERMIGMGDVEIFTGESGEEPSLVLKEIFNPDGMRELIRRLIATTPDTPDWAHIDKTKPIVY